MCWELRYSSWNSRFIFGITWVEISARSSANLSKDFNVQFQLFHDTTRQQYGVTVTSCCSYSCFVLLKMGDSDAPKHVEQLSDKINSVTCASCWDLYTRILSKDICDFIQPL